MLGHGIFIIISPDVNSGRDEGTLKFTLYAIFVHQIRILD